jgi:hypothetical protein
VAPAFGSTIRTVRTTVTIDDRLLRQAKEAAARSGRTLSELVDDGLRLLLHQTGRREPAPLSLPVFGGSGLHRGVDLDDKDRLAALLDDEDGPRSAR